MHLELHLKETSAKGHVQEHIVQHDLSLQKNKVETI